MLSKADFFNKFSTVMPNSSPADGVEVSDDYDVYFTSLTLDGLNEMHRYSIDERLYDHFEFPPFTQLDDTRTYLNRLMQRMSGDQDTRVATYWFVRRKSDDYLIGTAVLIDLNYSRQSIEWGYGIDPELWGYGYILQIQEILKAYAFDVLELNRIHGITMVNNHRTIESLLATGMAHEGVASEHYCKNGTFIDGWRYAITRAMYEGQKSKTEKYQKTDDTLKSVVALVTNVFPAESISEDASMADTPSWDSLGHMQVIISLKENMGVELSPHDIAEATSIKSIVDIIHSLC